MGNFASKDLNDWTEYRGMVRWFHPGVLLKAARKVVISTIFGQYADRRLVHAALDSPISRRALLKESLGGKRGVCRRRPHPEIWVDYVADLGDGFDSTYAIAHLIGRREIQVDGNNLPRADCLVMGGDQVYPDASRDDYHKRMLRPYRAAFPRSSKPGSYHPPVYLIPGNHDWYDGLTLFLANFCRGRKTPVGSWVASQRRSYFAVRLANNWWIWGFDSQLGEDIDKPQADYFETIAKLMEPGARVVLCASVPAWLKATLAATNKEELAQFYRSLDYIANIVRDGCRGAKIPLVLSGDLHHYSRYIAKESGTQFITAGGGGAFLHPTHFIVKDTIKIKWARSEQTLEIADSVNSRHEKAIYPTHAESRALSLRNLRFFYRNWDFCFVLGGLYWVLGLLLLAWNGYGRTGGDDNLWDRLCNQAMDLWPTPVFLFVAFALLAIFIKTADIKSDLPKTAAKWLERAKAFRPTWRRYTAVLDRLERARAYLASRKLRAVFLHWLAHLTAILFSTAFVSILAAELQPDSLFGELVYFITLSIGLIFCGFVGGIIWGVYLTAVSWAWGDEANNAFSALRLDSYRHFVRLRIEGDKITIFPICVDKPPQRNGWKWNDQYEDANPDQDTPAILPKNDIGHRLIEGPIVIDANNVVPLKAV